MPGAVIGGFADPQNASVFDPYWLRVARRVAKAVGMADPQSQAMGIAAGVDVPGDVGGLVGMLKEKFPKLADHIIKAYHGSPHDFEQFSLEKIGTGEGAQAYGHGLYFAENPGVAEQYRADLTQRPIQVAPGTPLNTIQHHIVQYLSSHNVPLDDKAIMSVGDAMTSAPFDVGPRNQQTWEKWKAAFEELRPRLSQVEKPGRTYEVAIKAHPDQFLDWDKPLSQQSEYVQEKLRDLVPAAQGRIGADNPVTGETVLNLLRSREGYGDSAGVNVARATIAAGRDPVHRLKSVFPNITAAEIQQTLTEAAQPAANAQERATRELRARGIPGIKYLDQGSRSAGEGSRNYVVFDDTKVDILKKYGLLPPVAGALLNQQGTDDAGNH